VSRMHSSSSRGSNRGRNFSHQVLVEDLISLSYKQSWNITVRLIDMHENWGAS
jgi:hypothetical protein